MRMEVFREYPFLYEGDLDYEMRYLEKKYTTMKNGIVVAVFDDKKLIGVSTGYPFEYEIKELQDVFTKAGREPKEYFCFGESVLNKNYRGLGIGKTFFKEREAHVQNLGKYSGICFFTIVRPEDDPRRPADYRPLKPFWEKQGYREHQELKGSVAYQEIGETEETPKEMVFWIKLL